MYTYIYIYIYRSPSIPLFLQISICIYVYIYIYIYTAHQLKTWLPIPVVKWSEPVLCNQQQFMAVWNQFAGAPHEAVEVVPAPAEPAALGPLVKGAANERNM